MAEKPTGEMIERMHRWFAVECNNQAWELAGRPERSADENRQLLLLAYTAAFHWSQVGTAVNVARAETLLAQVLALTGQGRLAEEFAARCREFFSSGQGADWDMAFAHLVSAHAAAACADAKRHGEHLAAASKAGAAIQDDEDRRIFMEELGRIPQQVAQA